MRDAQPTLERQSFVRQSPLAADGRQPKTAAMQTNLRALPAHARLQLRIREDAVRGIPQAGGFRLDLPINTFWTDGVHTALRLGPDEWQLTGPELTGPEPDLAQLLARLAADLAGVFHVLADISHRQITFALAGPDAINVLNTGCALDLHPTRFPTGRATRTLLAKAEIILSRTDDTPTFHITCGRSFARYTQAVLLEACRE